MPTKGSNGLAVGSSLVLAALATTVTFYFAVVPSQWTSPAKASYLWRRAVKSFNEGSNECRWRRYSDFPNYNELYPGQSPPNISKIFYSKVSKTGSTTVSTLLMHFSANHNLTVLRPGQGVVTGPQYVRTAMENDHLTSIDVILNHAHYTETLTREFLSTKLPNGTRLPPFLITSVRHPHQRLLSAFYFGHERVRGGGNPSSWVCPNLLNDYKAWVATCRPTPQHLYMSPSNWEEKRRQDVDELLRHFDHFFVTERMAESILTLAPKFRLTLREMLVVPRKFGVRKVATSSILEPEEVADMERRAEQAIEKEKIMRIDMGVYRRVQQRLDSEMEALPGLLKGAVDDLRNMTEELAKACTESEENPDKSDGLRSWGAFDKCISSWLSKNVYCKS